MLYIWMTVVFLLLKVTNANSTTPLQSITQCGNLTCYNHSRCRHGMTGVDLCLCTRGHSGHTCFNDVDECSIGDPCNHRGHCRNNFGSYRCDCLDGWSGDVHCDIKDNSTTVHKCMPGWMGDWCHDNCLNDSLCRPTEICKQVGRPTDSEAKKGHQCRCAPGWHGVNCSIDYNECLSWRSQCPKKSICMNTPGSYKCPCLFGWTGDNCTEDIDECLANPCQHSSTCTNEQGSYNCTCAPGWRGDNCTEEKSDSRTTYIIVGAVLGSFLIIYSIVASLCIVKHKWKRRGVVANTRFSAPGTAKATK